MSRKLFALAALPIIVCLTASAQSGTVEMADGMRSNGKIYVVVAVVLTILAGIILYLVRLDKKITKLEQKTFVDDSLHLKS